MQIIDDESREFFTSQMVRLEVLPKPRFEKRDAEVAFYENHFRDCSFTEPLSKELGRGGKACNPLWISWARFPPTSGCPPSQCS